MKIKNIEIKDFRNINRANVSFGDINIITGKNSSGKSNFLLALYHSLSLEKDYSQIFKGNIVTFQKGKDRTTFRVTVDDIREKIIFNDNGKFVYVAPKEFLFEKIIDKRTSSSRSHILFFTGKFAVLNQDKSQSNLNFKDKFEMLEKNSEEMNGVEVYREIFSHDIEDADTKIINIGGKSVEHKDKYRSIFSGYFQTIKSWLGDSNFSSNAIYNFVTQRQNNEDYEQAVNYLNQPTSDKTKGFTTTPFEKAKFLFLLADIQRDNKALKNLKNDLPLYTKGIVTDLSINTVGRSGNKGEIIVNSPQGPKDIFTISTGTAVLLYFIVLKNWLKVFVRERTYQAPEVMIFDEVESILHPSLMDEFHELLRFISKDIQLFIATHSPRFIDYFEKNEVYLIKDTPSLPEKPGVSNRCNIYDYEAIIKNLPKDKQSVFLEGKNSELFVDSVLDLIFP